MGRLPRQQERNTKAQIKEPALTACIILALCMPPGSRFGTLQRSSDWREGGRQQYFVSLADHRAKFHTLPKTPCR